MIAAPPEPKQTAARPRTVWQEQLGRAPSPWPYRRRLWIAACVALALHGAMYYFSRESVIVAAEYGMEDAAPSMDVEIVAGEETAEPATPEPPPTEATPPPEPEPQPEPPPSDPIPEPEPTPVPEPMPDPEPMKEEMTEPVPEPPKPTPPPPKPKPKPVAKAAPKPATPTLPTTGARQGAPSGTAVAGAPGGTGRAKGGRSSGPGYLYNPKPKYPPESLAAGESGRTVVAVKLDASGRPTSASLLRSSGYSRLDRAAVEAVRRWRFKPAMRDGTPFPSSVEVPVLWKP